MDKKKGVLWKDTSQGNLVIKSWWVVMPQTWTSFVKGFKPALPLSCARRLTPLYILQSFLHPFIRFKCKELNNSIICKSDLKIRNNLLKKKSLYILCLPTIQQPPNNLLQAQ